VAGSTAGQALKKNVLEKSEPALPSNLGKKPIPRLSAKNKNDSSEAYLKPGRTRPLGLLF